MEFSLSIGIPDREEVAGKVLLYVEEVSELTRSRGRSREEATVITITHICGRVELEARW